jgi:hypothetical protein
MKHGLIAFLAAVLFTVCAATTPALAASPTEATSALAPPAPASANPPTNIIVDEKSGVVRIVINGQDKLVVDASGLHVNGSVTYSGTVADTNAEYHPATNAGQTSK